MTELTTLAKDATNDEIKAVLDRDGGCILEGLVPVETCDALMAELRPQIDAAPWNNASGKEDKAFFGVKTKRFHGVASMSPLAQALYAHPRLLELANDVLRRGEQCRDIRLSTIELMVLGDGQGNQMLHRDFDSWPYIEVAHPDVRLFSANIALCDFTADNGATVVVPGSHLWPADRQAKPEETCLAVMKKGSALLYTGHVIHGGGENRTPDIRTGFYIGYIPSWLRGLENHQVTNDMATLRKLDARTQRLFDMQDEGFVLIV